MSRKGRGASQVDHEMEKSLYIEMISGRVPVTLVRLRSTPRAFGTAANLHNVYFREIK